MYNKGSCLDNMQAASYRLGIMIIRYFQVHLLEMSGSQDSSSNFVGLCMSEKVYSLIWAEIIIAIQLGRLWLKEPVEQEWKTSSPPSGKFSRLRPSEPSPFASTLLLYNHQLLLQACLPAAIKIGT